MFASFSAERADPTHKIVRVLLIAFGVVVAFPYRREGNTAAIPEALRGPEGGIAVRWTSHLALQRLIRAHGDAITSTSANRPGVPPATSASEIREQWGDALAHGTLRLLDGGTLQPSPPSTVVDCTLRAPRVIRPGAVPAARLREIAPRLIGDA